MHNPDSDYIFNISGYKRKPTLSVRIGELELGGNNPIRLQTMTTTNTNNIKESVEQSIRAIQAGAELIRLTAQGVKEANNLALIKQEISEMGYNTPIVADIHFNSAVALEAAKYADKIRINPGNYSDKSRTSSTSFADSEYDDELERAENRFLELLKVCKQNNVAIRIGVNHGSLSQRIMNRYGDTPLGMAISAMEFVNFCHKNNYHKVVVSMKSSNTRVMVQATRCLVKLMAEKGLNYPLHLGVTEAGEGEDGRIKSAVGIGTLLVDGIGDTIRVSLTEEPENEIPVAKELVQLFNGWPKHQLETNQRVPINPYEYNRRTTHPVLNIGGNHVPVVMANLSSNNPITSDTLEQWGWIFNEQTKEWQSTENSADYLFVGNNSTLEIECTKGLPIIGKNSKFEFQVFSREEFLSKLDKYEKTFFIKIKPNSIDEPLIGKLKESQLATLIVDIDDPYHFFSLRNALFKLIENGVKNPCILSCNLPNATPQNFQIVSSAIVGPLFIDGLGDGLMLSAPQNISTETIKTTLFGILQASRVRFSKTEFISCPGCGRTLFNLNQTLLKVKQRTAHLKGLKIGVMGCIVNGPGEMADADYGYVGSGAGKVSLYKQKEVVKKNVPEANAVDELIALIKANGDWVDAKKRKSF